MGKDNHLNIRTFKIQNQNPFDFCNFAYLNKMENIHKNFEDYLGKTLAFRDKVIKIVSNMSFDYSFALSKIIMVDNNTDYLTRSQLRKMGCNCKIIRLSNHLRGHNRIIGKTEHFDSEFTNNNYYSDCCFIGCFSLLLMEFNHNCLS